MGVVWKADDTVLDRTVAIKVLLPDVSRDERRRQMFLEEAKNASATNDPHIVHVYEFGKQDDLDFIVMEYVNGTPLNKILHGRPLPAEKVAALGEQMARAVSQAHKNHLLHRDLKPSNVLVTPEGDVKIVDFGLATLFEHRRSQMATTPASEPATRGEEVDSRRTVAGTVPYMSPEQARGEEIDARSDIFSLGVVLYEMTAGQRPFIGATTSELVDEILHSRPRPPHQLVSKLPLELDRIIQKALARQRVNRYQTMEDLAVDLKRLGRELESGSSPSYQDITAEPRPRRRRRGITATLSTALALAAIAAGIWFLRSAFVTPLDERAVLILPFEVRGGGMAEVGETFAEAIAVGLAQADDLHVLPVPRFDTELSIDPLEKGHSTGAGRVLSGWLRRENSRLQAGVQLFDVQENRILWGTSYNEPDHQLSTLSSELVREVAAALGAGLGADYDYPLYLSGDPEMVGSPDAAAAIEAWRTGGAVEALRPTERLIASFPAEISPRAMQAFFLDQTQSWEELEAVIDTMDRVDPNNPYSEYFRAKLLYKHGQLDLMKQKIDDLLTRQDFKPGLRAWVLRNPATWILYTENLPLDLPVKTPLQVSAEIAALEESILLDPASAWGFLYLGHALHHAGRAAEAVGYARRGAALEPTFSMTHRYTGAFMMAAGRWDEAHAPLAKACELGSTTSCGMRPLALHRAGEVDEARTLAEQLSAEARPGWPGYHEARYWALVGESRRAIETLGRVVVEGWVPDRIVREAEFDTLRGNPRFDAFVARLQGK